MELRAASRCLHRATHPFGIGLALFCSLSSASLSALGQRASVRLSGHVPSLVAQARGIGRTSAQEPVSLALILPLRDPAGLNALLAQLYDPTDPEYRQYLTSEQFTASFGPTQADYEALVDFAHHYGLTVTGRHANRLVLDVAGPASSVEAAFGVTLQQYVLPDGRVFRAPAGDPVVPANLAGLLQGVVGLDTAAVWLPNCIRRPDLVPGPGGATPLWSGFGLGPLGGGSGPAPLGGSGPYGGFTPADIKAAYSLSGTELTGAGQTLALFELDGYTASDITAYQKMYGLAAPPLQNILVDGASGKAGGGADEVTLDIELQNALAPGATAILVYEGPNSGQGVIDTYNKIATDNLAKSISSSWGLPEDYAGTVVPGIENIIFQQMAAQGQSIFIAAGDSGAYDDGATLSVDDPASQPWVTGVGGTTLTTNQAGGPWYAERVWNHGGAGGGGISSNWSIPSWQPASILSAASEGSLTNRNVPDVSLDADPYTGYSIYFGGGWTVFGGTSCAAPLWSAFTALVNEELVARGKNTLGFANPPLYAVGEGKDYGRDFHDIVNGNNEYYPAVKGYDLATGWGTLNGGNLLIDLAGLAFSNLTVTRGCIIGAGRGLLQQPIRVTNSLDSALTSPVALLLENLPSSATLLSATQELLNNTPAIAPLALGTFAGPPPTGTPYILLNATGSLAPGASITIQLTFQSVPSFEPVSYTTEFLLAPVTP